MFCQSRAPARHQARMRPRGGGQPGRCAVLSRLLSPHSPILTGHLPTLCPVPRTVQALKKVSFLLSKALTLRNDTT